jgi:hypothetical protein
VNRKPELPDQVVSRKTAADEADDKVQSAKRSHRSLQSSPAPPKVVLGDPTLDAWKLVTDFDRCVCTGYRSC